MRYLMMVKGDADYEAGSPPSEKLQALMGDYIGKCFADGTLVDAGGLLPTRHGARFSARDGEITVIDGPFAEAREIVGGYAIVEVPDDAAARQVARDFIDVHFLGGVDDLDVEIRPLAQ